MNKPTTTKEDRMHQGCTYKIKNRKAPYSSDRMPTTGYRDCGKPLDPRSSRVCTSHLELEARQLRSAQARKATR